MHLVRGGVAKYHHPYRTAILPAILNRVRDRVFTDSKRAVLVNPEAELSDSGEVVCSDRLQLSLK